MIYESSKIRLFVLALAVVAAGPVGFGAKKAWDLQANRVEDWLPESFEETQRLRWFVERFGSDELLTVSWKGCTFDDARLHEFSKKLQQPAFHDGRQVQWFRQVWTGPDALGSLTADPINLSQAAAVGRLQGWLVGPDGKTTCALALVSEAGAADRESAVEFALTVADSVSGLSRDEIHLAGPTNDSVAINNASRSSLLQFNLWSFLICFTLLLVCLRNIKLAWSVFVTAIFCQQSSMALMYYSGVPMDSVLLLVANLTFVLTIAGGIHLVNYYLEGRRIDHQSPVASAVGAARWPTLMAACTTALGMISLCVSQITPVRNFGLFAALSVLAAVGVLFTLLPVMLAQFPPKVQNLAAGDKQRIHIRPIWQRLTRVVVHFRWGVLFLATAALAFGVIGVMRLNASTRLQDLFSPEARVMHDGRWLEKHVAYLVPIEVVIQFPVDMSPETMKKDLATSFIQRMDVVEVIRKNLATIDGIGGSITAKDFVPLLPKGRGFSQLIRRRALIRAIYTRRNQLNSLGLWQVSGTSELWRISLRASSAREIDYGKLLDTIDQRAGKILDAQVAERRPTVIVCGGVPLVFKAQAQLLDDLVLSFGLALLMIAAVMVCLLRGPITGILAMIPNVLPSAIVFGAMGWMQWPIEIGSMLTATAAMGIAVDDTLHLIAWFRRGQQENLSTENVLSFAYARCGRAMIQTSLVCSLGLVVFALSPFMPIARFAWLMFTLILLAVASDLLVLPAILLTTTRPRRE